MTTTAVSASKSYGSKSSSKNKFNETILTKNTKNDNNFFTKFNNYPDFSFPDSERKGLHANINSTHETFYYYK